MSIYTRSILLAAILVPLTSVGVWADSLVYCSEGNPENFTPALNSNATSLDAVRPVFNQLVEFERGSTNVVPALAESYEVSDGGLTITFHLRKGIKVHSGVNGFTPTRDLNAEDVIFSFERMWKPDHPYAKVSGGAYDYFNDMGMPDLLKSIEKGADDLTVVMKLNKPNAPIIANLAMDFATIQSAEYAKFLMDKGTPEQFDQIPVGTGPFQLVDYQMHAMIRFKAFDAYWGGKAKFDDLVYAITPDPTARYAKLKANECQVMGYPNPADLADMDSNPDIQLLQQAGLNIGYLSLNVTKPPFDRKEVRQAINMAIDRDSILREVYQGTGQKAKNPIPPTMWSYNDAVTDYEYNPNRAREMLRAAGVENLQSDLWWMPVQRPYNPNPERMAEMMRVDLASVGINVELKSFEWGEYRNRLQQGEHQMGLLGWTGDNGDPDNFFFLLGCTDSRADSQNISKWCNTNFEGRLRQARKSSDSEERTRIYKEMQVVFKEEAPWVTIAHSNKILVLNKNDHPEINLLDSLGRIDFRHLADAKPDTLIAGGGSNPTPLPLLPPASSSNSGGAFGTFVDGISDPDGKAIASLFVPDLLFAPVNSQLSWGEFQGNVPVGLVGIVNSRKFIESVAPGEGVDGIVGIPRTNGQLVQVVQTELAQAPQIAASRRTAPAHPIPDVRDGKCSAPENPQIPSDWVFFREQYLASIDKTTGASAVRYCRDGFPEVVFIQLDDTVSNTCSGVLIKSAPQASDQNIGAFLITAKHCLVETMKVFVALPENMACLENRAISNSSQLASEECKLNGLAIDFAKAQKSDTHDLAVVPIQADSTLQKVSRFANVLGLAVDNIVLLTNAGFGQTSETAAAGKTGHLSLNWAMGENTEEPGLIVRAIRQGLIIASLACRGDSGGPSFLGRPFGYSDEVHELFAIASERDADGDTCGLGLPNNAQAEFTNVRSVAVKAFLCTATSNSLSYCG